MMNNFERLSPHLRAFIHDARLSEAAARDIAAFRREGAYLNLPHNPEEDQALFLLRLAADTLAHLAKGDVPAALLVARQALELPLVPEPFGGSFQRLGARVAGLLGEPEMQAHFESRSRAYEERFASSRAVVGLGEALLDPYLAGVLEEVVEDWQGEAVKDAEPSASSYPVAGLESAYLPLASSSSEANTRTYVVLVHKLVDPRVAAFAILNATLADITDGGDYGRIDAQGTLHADLLLDFADDAHALLDSLNPDGLAIRLVFRHSDAFETFATADGSLFDVESSVEEGRVYFKLRVPPAWVAAQLPLYAIWSNLESCVLLSEDA